jgi:hypothetical protein
MRDHLFALAVGCAVATGVSWHLTRLVAEQSALSISLSGQQSDAINATERQRFRSKRVGHLQAPEIVPFAAGEFCPRTLERPLDFEQFLRQRWAFAWNESVDALLVALQKLDLRQLQRQYGTWWARWRQQQRSNHATGDQSSVHALGQRSAGDTASVL